MTRRTVLLMIAAIFLLALPFDASEAPAQGVGVTPGQFRFGPLVSLPGSLPRLAATRPIGSLAPTRSITISIGLRLRDQAGLARLLHALYNPTSSRFHRWLDPREFQSRFTPLPAD